MTPPKVYRTTHLGSTSVIVNGSNVTIAKDLYQPYGDVRYQWRTGTPPIGTQTQYRCTGQRHQPETMLYDYNARWYDNRRGRFIQPDTIVPQPGDPQSLNRYMHEVIPYRGGAGTRPQIGE